MRMQVLAEQKKEFEAYDVHEFRELVDHMVDPKAMTLAKVLYLTCCRVNELCLRGNPSDILNGLSTPLGFLSDVELKDFPFNGKQEKIFVIETGVEKRVKVAKKDREKAKLMEQPTPEDVEAAFMRYGLKNLVKRFKAGKLKDSKREPRKILPTVIARMLGQIHMKKIAIPLDPKYEPWAIDLKPALYPREDKLGIGFKMTRSYCDKLLKWEFKKLGMEGWHPHWIRKQRISDLVNCWGLTPPEVSSITGWTLRSGYQGTGLAVSSSMDSYWSGNYRSYLPKLLVDFNSL